MNVVKLYDGKTRMYPSGKVATAEQIYADYPAVQVFPHVIITDAGDQVIYSIANLAQMKDRYNIDPSLSDEEAVAAIQEAINTVPEPEPQEEVGPTPEERQAVALEAIAAGRTSEQQMETDEAIAELTTMVAELQALQA